MITYQIPLDPTASCGKSKTPVARHNGGASGSGELIKDSITRFGRFCLAPVHALASWRGWNYRTLISPRASSYRLGSRRRLAPSSLRRREET